MKPKLRRWNSITVFLLLACVALGRSSPDMKTDVVAGNELKWRSNGITIDGYMDDWASIPPILEDPPDDTEWMNIEKAWITNDSEFLYCRILYSQKTEYLLLWSNITCRLDNGSVYLLSAFASTPDDSGARSQEDTWILDAESLDNPITGGWSFFAQFPKTAKMDDHDTAQNIEFKIPLDVLGHPKFIDLVFWHWDVFRASSTLKHLIFYAKRLPMQTEPMDRAPDSGYVTYLLNESSSSGLPSMTSSSASGELDNLEKTEPTSGFLVTSIIFVLGTILLSYLNQKRR